MEQKRLLLAIVLSTIVFIGWSLFFVKPTQNKNKTIPEQKPEAVATQKEEVKTSPIESTVPKKSPVLTKSNEPKSVLSPDLKNARTIRIDTPLYKISISERAGAVTSVILKKFRERVDKDSPLKELIPQEVKLQYGTFWVGLENQGLDIINSLFAADTENENIVVKGEKRRVSFTYTSDKGLNITKTFTFVPDSYLVDVDITVQNYGEKIISDKIAITLQNKVATKKTAYGFEGPSALIDGKLVRVAAKKIEKNKHHSGEIRWIALEDRYFMTSVIPKTQIAGDLNLDVNGKIVTSKLLGPGIVLPAQSQKSYKFSLFMGPKKLSILKAMHNGLDKAVKFGWFDFLAKPFLWFMNFIYKFIPNYGVAIIILTIVSKLVVWPLGNKSYKSMNQMKKLQPLMNEIKEKYKNDKQKMNQEMMALYKTYKVNPMGGCLPMLLQIPVFFALYQMLYQAIELRHAPFILWINDLSAPDRLFRFNFSIPLMEPPYGIPVLTIIMGITMILQQRMSPPPGDPAQAKMMMLMPVFFTVIFINFSSGLVLYWLVSNILSIAQQMYVQKKAA